MTIKKLLNETKLETDWKSYVIIYLLIKRKI